MDTSHIRKVETFLNAMFDVLPLLLIVFSLPLAYAPNNLVIIIELLSCKTFDPHVSGGDRSVQRSLSLDPFRVDVHLLIIVLDLLFINQCGENFVVDHLLETGR